jgi:hypothetical protein
MRPKPQDLPGAKEEAMKTLIALPLALAIGLAAPVAATAAAARYGPVHTHRAIHHSISTMRAQTLAAAPAYLPVWPKPSGGHETDGLSRNPDDCASYGCIDNGGP